MTAKQTDQNAQATVGPAVASRGGWWNKEWLPLVVLAVFLIVFAARAVASMVQESATWDETHYFGLGKYLLQNRRWDVPGSILHPPLSYYLHSIPWLFFSTDSDVWKPPPQLQKPRYRALTDIVRGQSLLSSPANDGDRLLNWSRFMMVLTAVLLGWYVYLWSFSLYGKWIALLATVLYSFCPNILAHARLITPDITITAFFFISMYYFWRLMKDNRTDDAVAGGICLGLAMLSKFTGILLIPVCFALAATWRAKQKTWCSQLPPLRRHRNRRLAFGIWNGPGALFCGHPISVETRGGET